MIKNKQGQKADIPENKAKGKIECEVTNSDTFCSSLPLVYSNTNHENENTIKTC